MITAFIDYHERSCLVDRAFSRRLVYTATETPREAAGSATMLPPMMGPSSLVCGGRSEHIRPRQLCGHIHLAAPLGRATTDEKNIRPMQSLDDSAADAFESDEELEDFLAFTYAERHRETLIMFATSG